MAVGIHDDFHDVNILQVNKHLSHYCAIHDINDCDYDDFYDVHDDVQNLFMRMMMMLFMVMIFMVTVFMMMMIICTLSMKM